MLEQRTRSGRTRQCARHAGLRASRQGSADERSAKPSRGSRSFPNANYVAASSSCATTTIPYLYVARLLDPRVVSQLRDTRASVSEYALMEARRARRQVAFGLMYTVIALIVLLSAVWIGLNFANRLVAPIRRLIGAANVGRDRQSACAGAGTQVRRRSRPARRDLQPHDPRPADPARRPRARPRPDRQPPPLHRSGAGRRQRRHHRRRSRRQDQHSQPLGRAADRPLRAPMSSASRCVEVVPELAEIVEQAHRERPAADAGAGHAQPQGRERNLSVRVTSEQIRRRRTRLCRHARRHHRAGHRRSAPRPGPTSRAASRTRSRIR